MKVIATKLPGVLILEPRVLGDGRGFFMETYNQPRYAEAGIRRPFVQDNLSFSARGVLRGLHLQHPHVQGKLVSVLQGEVWDVAVDVRRGSLTFGQWTGVVLSADNKRQFYVPEGFAHGYCALSETALFFYKCTDVYHPETEVGIRWNDPELTVGWPLASPTLSDRDARNPLLRDVLDRLPAYEPLAEA